MKKIIIATLLAVGIIAIPTAANASVPQLSTSGCHVYSPIAYFHYGVAPDGMVTMATNHFRIQTCGSTRSDIDVTGIIILNSVPTSMWVRANLFHPDGSYASSTAWKYLKSSTSVSTPIATGVLNGTIYNVEGESGGLLIYFQNLRD